MTKTINLTTGGKLNSAPLILVLDNQQPALADWAMTAIEDKFGVGTAASIKQIIAAKAKPGASWRLKSEQGQDVIILATGAKPLTRLALDKLGRKLGAAVKQLQTKTAQLLCAGLQLDTADESLQGCDFDNYGLRSITLSITDAVYSYDDFKSAKLRANSSPLQGLTILQPPQEQKLTQQVKQLAALAKGLHLAKELANAPPNLCTPPYLAAQGKALAKQYNKLSCKVLGEKEMKQLKMGAYLAVTDGSAYPPQLVIMEYRGGKKQDKPVVLIGKGMTFDTGGISIKPAGKMDEMKYDMCGAASVFGALKFVAELGLPINLVAMAAGAENSVDGKSYRPGDIVRTMSGQTVEVLNTDAEGRLVLCDTLTYAARYQPRYVVDIATLTGACVIALGHLRSGMFANDEGLAAALQKAGGRSQDLLWRLPLDAAYMEDMKSNFADIANVGNRAAGTITAAGFLAEFAQDFPWAHLDIAGSAWLEGAAKGATGRPVGLLAQLLLDDRGKQY